MNEELSPASWTVTEVVSWARQVRLAATTIAALEENAVDGPTLVTLTKTELQTELGISSLPARRYLWELIKSLRSEQETSDYSAAIRAHEEEIQTLAATVQSYGNLVESPDEASGGIILRNKNDDPSTLSMIMSELTLDAERQRQVLSDHMMAHKLQRAMKLGQEIYEDAELAHREQQRLNDLLSQAESDRQYAESLLNERERLALRRAATPSSAASASAASSIASVVDEREESDDAPVAATRFSSLFGLALRSCADNKINVAEAFRTGRVKPMLLPAVNDLVETDDDDDDNSGNDDDRKPAAVATRGTVIKEVDTLPFLEQCDVCYDENKRGYILACSHSQCTRCMKKLFQAALRDSTLLPLRCCEVPIDMNIGTHLLKHDDAQRILERVAEVEATKKMYCPTCSAFLNLDLIDLTMHKELSCRCGTRLCMECKTGAHPGITCPENQSTKTGSDALVLELARENNWKRCPSCEAMIELRSGCNHMTCANCRFEFCYICLLAWNARSGQCSSGRCEVWDETRLLEAGEARVQQQEAARGQVVNQAARAVLLDRAIRGLRANEVCNHQWVRSGGYKGDCPNCGFTMWAYGMRCRSDCGATVCYTCAHHRIPQRGWR